MRQKFKQNGAFALIWQALLAINFEVAANDN
jgi:hypothetical protein